MKKKLIPEQRDELQKNISMLINLYLGGLQKHHFSMDLYEVLNANTEEEYQGCGCNDMFMCERHKPPNCGRKEDGE